MPASSIAGAFHELHSDDMIADQEGETRRLLEFCGLPFEDACLRFHETERTVQAARRVIGALAPAP